MNICRYLLALALMSWMGYVSADGLYIGGGVITTKIEDSDAGFRFDDQTTGYRILAGYGISENLAIEGSYFDTGEAEDTILGLDVDAELTAFTLSVVGLLPLNDAWRLFGKVGYYDGEAEVDVSSLGSADDDESGLTAGVGARYNFNDNLGLRAEFDWFDTDLDRLWSIGVTLQYAFGR